MAYAELPVAISGITDFAQTRVVLYASGKLVHAPLSVVSARVLTPFMFGAVGDGVANDGPALNKMFAVVRAESVSAKGLASSQVATTIELSGGRWRTTSSINATGIVAWNLTVRGGTVIGSCTGKAVFDLVGSRGYQFIGVGVYGDPAAKPSAAFQAARPTASGFCDNASFYDCSTTGYFTRAAFHDYGQETTLHVHPTYYNSQHNARVAIFEGYDSNPFTSDYTTVMTGATSKIDNKVIAGDFRYLPGAGNIVAVTGVTNAASAVITATAHPFANGDEVVFASIGGMPGMSKAVGTVSGAAANSFTVNINSTALGAFTSGGVAIRRATKSPVLISRTRGFQFDCSYIVSYGRPGLEIAWPDAGFLSYGQIACDILFEGAGNASHVLLSPGAFAGSILGFSLKTYQSAAYTSLISLTDAGNVGLYNPIIECVNPLNASIPLCGPTTAKLGLYGARITYGGAANVDLSTYGAGSNGIVVDFNTGTTNDITIDTLNSTAKGTPVNADRVWYGDSTTLFSPVYATWTQVKAFLKTANDLLYQPLAAALTSWAGVTRAAGFDTFAATPSSANLAALVTDEDGTGLLALELTNTYTPTITASTGTFTTVSATGGYTKIGRAVLVKIKITITTVGTAGGFPIATLPFTANATGDWVLAGRETALGGKMLQGIIVGGSGTVSVLNYDNSNPIAAGAVLVLSGVYWV
jgi:hypothetical protein